VVAGKLSGASGNDTAHNRVAFGQAPALAAALRSVADPDTVLIAVITHGLLGGLFEYQAVGPLALDGFPSTVPAWLITNTNIAESRFDAVGQLLPAHNILIAVPDLRRARHRKVAHRSASRRMHHRARALYPAALPMLAVLS
jgi:hypothetical protein